MSKKRIVLILPEQPAQALAALMRAKMQHNATGYLISLIADEYRRMKLDKSTTNPDQEDEQKDYTNDTPKNMPYFGRMVGPKEYQDLKAASIALKNDLGLEPQG